VNIAKFIPSEMRARMVQDIIAEMGIRPLSNALGVNSKTVYKYKCGQSCPTDEKMTKILAVMKEKYPALLMKYVDELRNDFLAALKSVPTETEITITSRHEAPEKPEPESKMKTRRLTGKPGLEPTEVTKFEIYERLGLSNPIDRILLAKILAPMQGMQTFSIADLANKSNVPQDVVEEYVGRLAEFGYIRKNSRGEYQLAAKIQI
jgi:hypothetical protein